MNHLLRPLLLCALAASWSTTPAQNYPTKPLRLIVPGVPGAPGDIMARRVSPKLAATLGQPVVVENRPGAAGLIAAQEAVRAAADGYTLLNGTINDILREYSSNPQYPLSRTFAPVIRLTSFPNIIVVNPSIRAGSRRELVNLAKANPGAVTHAAAGRGSGTSLLGALFKSVAGVDMLEVHYKSPGAEMPDLLSGQVQIAFAQLSVVGQHLRSGKLRALAVTHSKRITAFPDIPTTAEAGLPEVAFTTMSGILVLAGTARPIILQLHQHLAKIINDPDFKDQVVATGGEIGGESPEEFAAYLRAESAKWGKLIKANGIKME